MEKMNNGLRKNILSLLERNARLSAGEIAVYLDAPETDVADEIAKLEADQIVCGYGAFINWDRMEDEYLEAFIEVKVTPSRGQGFNRIAERISQFDEVKAVHLMSGSYDLAVMIAGKSIKDISLFVSDKLSPLESVLSTATHFVLRKYKDHGVIFNERPDDGERLIVSP